MPGADAPTRTRKSAVERRDEIVTAAIRHFAAGGYAGTSTEAIARDAGISQPYLFRLFKTKRELFLACQEVCHRRVLDTFAAAVEGVPVEQRLERMGEAYKGLLADRTMLLFQLQSYAASGDPAVRAQVRDRYGELIREVARLTQAEPEALWSFFGSGMLLNVVAALDLPVAGDAREWIAHWGAP